MEWKQCHVVSQGETSDNICQFKKSQSSLFILDDKKWRNFYLNDGKGKLWVEVDHCYFFGRSSDCRCLHSMQWWRKTWKNSSCTFRMTIKSSSRFERINKLDRDFSCWQILSLACLLKYHATLLLSHHSYSACKDSGYRECLFTIFPIINFRSHDMSRVHNYGNFHTEKVSSSSRHPSERYYQSTTFSEHTI